MIDATLILNISSLKLIVLVLSQASLVIFGTINQKKMDSF